MALEIERKFLVVNDEWKKKAKPYRVIQGYLQTAKECTIRVRVVDDKAALTIKGENIGATRQEYEYAIPVIDALEILENLCVNPLIDKTRYLLDYRGLTWEIDEFHRENEGLVIAEVELKSEQMKIEYPSWLGEEVTGNERYYNSYLSVHPYKTWSE
jgi:CYTH domain-containing protein